MHCAELEVVCRHGTTPRDYLQVSLLGSSIAMLMTSARRLRVFSDRSDDKFSLIRLRLSAA